MDEYRGAAPAHYRAGNNGQPELPYLMSLILGVQILRKKTAGGQRGGGGGIISFPDLT